MNLMNNITSGTMLGNNSMSMYQTPTIPPTIHNLQQMIQRQQQSHIGSNIHGANLSINNTNNNSSSNSNNNSKEAFENFDNVDPQAKKAFDHANTILDNSNNDKTFSIFSIPPREALAFYMGVEEHYQKEQAKPVCPLCLRQFQFSALSRHVVSCAEYRNSLLSMEEAPPIKPLPSPYLSVGHPLSFGASNSMNGMNGIGGLESGGPLLGKRKKLDSEIPSGSSSLSYLNY